jgi:hypothetical protein
MPCALKKNSVRNRALQVPQSLEIKRRVLLFFNLGFGNHFMPAFDICG